ncbi:MAG: response regulator [Acidobacteria bacterium]|nr:MAG: response regulator [Acidobacteriota bacterium]
MQERRARGPPMASMDSEKVQGRSHATVTDAPPFARRRLEALARAVARRPDAVVIDVAVPVMDGWEVTRRLKAAAATRDIPVIAVTASDPQGARARASEAGCAACLAKPCRPEELREEVERQLGLYRPRPRRRGRAGRV